MTNRGNTSPPQVRTGQAEWPLSRAEFERRFKARFSDPAFADKAPAIEQLLEVAWEGYRESRKSPRTLTLRSKIDGETGTF
jgi:hypothetical protein